MDLLADAERKANGLFPITYAGGIGSFEDLEAVRQHGRNRIDVTIGSALNLFGGKMDYRKVIAECMDEA